VFGRKLASVAVKIIFTFKITNKNCYKRSTSRAIGKQKAAKKLH
jgi:hypothetical protein